MKRMMVAAACVALLGTTACGGDEQAGDDAASPPPSPQGSSPQQPPATTGSGQQPGGECAGVIEGLSPREKAAQLLVVGVEPSDPAAAVALVRDNHVGGIFIGGNDTAVFTGDALEQVQEVAGDVPVSVAIDDEGGRVQRIDDLVGSIPSAREMAQSMSPDEVEQLAAERGEQMRSRGVTVDYAPVVDLTDGPANGAIGDRSFSADPQTATEYAAAFAKGLAEADVTPVIKHFPGHGRTDGDSHQELVQTPPLKDLRESDLVPYDDLSVYPEGTQVMVGHLDVPGLTDGQPASLSPAAYQLLRQDYGYTGPVVTDDLGAMKAISDKYSLDEAVLLALQSGADQALWSSGGDVGPVLDRLESAVTNGELPKDRLNDALSKSLKAKGACG